MAVLTAALASCGTGGPGQENSDGVPNWQQNGGLRWGSADDPSIFDDDLVYAFDELPLEGAAENPPWPANYWPVYKDSINHRWDGDDTDSAAAKYGLAFGVDNVEEQVSRYHGIARYSDRTECENDDACNKDIGESCAKRLGDDKGRCIPTWWGICHAWAPASMLEGEPQHPVTRGDVTFKVNDIKALLTLTYNRTYSKFVSLRCNEDDSQDEIEYDEYGRPTGSDTECRDTNPGTFHVIITNFLGLRQQSFVEDRTFDHEVWNQPMRSFRVLETRQVDFQEANALIGATTTGGQTTKRDGTIKRDEWSHLGAFAVSSGTNVKVTMTGTNDADLYVRFGAEPTVSAYDCRPYVGGSSETCEQVTPEGVTQVFVSVRGYNTESNYDVTLTTGGSAPDQYVFNKDAQELVYIKARSSYVSESSASTDGPLTPDVDRYTYNDTYEYVLEIDANGKIMGGEWIGSSKRNHPDFLWLPTGRRYGSIAGGAISYDKVKSLLDESREDPNGGGGETVVVDVSGSVERDGWKHYGPFNVLSGSLTAVLSGTGDTDLYIRKGSRPTNSAYDCRPYKNGSAESCEVTGPGNIFVSVKGYASTSHFAVTITYIGESNGGGGGDDPPPPTGHLNESGSVAQGVADYYTVEVQADTPIVVTTTGTGDADLYIRFGDKPTGLAFDARSTSWTSSEQVTYTPTVAGTLHIMVYGYSASDYTLTTADQ